LGLYLYFSNGYSGKKGSKIESKDIAVDGWVISILSEAALPYGAMTQTAGFILGNLFSRSFFVLLSSVEFSNKYIYSTP
jgi:hypothetical protein